jgi:hypothetical protein
MAVGGYNSGFSPPNFTPSTTSATRLFIHGGGATLSQQSDSPLLTSTLSLTIRDLTFNCGGVRGLQLGGGDFLLERISLTNGCSYGISLAASATIRDSTLDGCNDGIYVGGGHLTLDRTIIKNTTRGIYGGTGSTIEVTNTIVHSASGLALDLPFASGTVSSSTIADSGSDAGTGPRAVLCSSLLTVRSSIVWAPGATARVPIDGCNLISTIAGPTSTPGATNVNPQFVDAAAHDYHLDPNSPARDAVDSGPAEDFEGDARPLGVRFDIGADEASP